jgi:hypothetical protein
VNISESADVWFNTDVNISGTTAREIAGHQIQNNRNPIIKIPQTYKYFTPF